MPTICVLMVTLTALGLAINGQTSASKSDADREKIADECTTPGRPQPAIEKSLSKKWLLCGKAISLTKPNYPAEAKAKGISGLVNVEVVFDEKGRVIWAKVIEGPELLQSASVKAACQARYSPIEVSGRAVKAKTIITYNFVKQ